LGNRRPAVVFLIEKCGPVGATRCTNLESRHPDGRASHGEHCRYICNIPAQGLTGLIGYSYQQVATSFPEVHLERTPKLSVLGLDRWVTDREVLSGYSRVRTKCAEKTCVGL
jgi:hypothetical protein